MREGRWRFYGVVAIAVIAMLGLVVHALSRDQPRDPMRHELARTERPTGTEVAAAIGASFAEPYLLTATEKPERSTADFIAWQLRYDGIDLDVDVRSSHRGGGWITRWYPITSSPPRWHHGDELSDAAARTHAHTGADATVRRVYHGKLTNTWKGGAHTAENSFYVFAGFTPAIEVMGRDGVGALIDAYSGALIEKRSSWVD